MHYFSQMNALKNRIQNEELRLNAIEIAMWHQLHTWANPKWQDWFEITNAKLADFCGMSTRQLFYVRPRLIDAGLILYESCGTRGSGRYHLVKLYEADEIALAWLQRNERNSENITACGAQVDAHHAVIEPGTPSATTVCDTPRSLEIKIKEKEKENKKSLSSLSGSEKILPPSRASGNRMLGLQDAGRVASATMIAHGGARPRVQERQGSNQSSNHSQAETGQNNPLRTAKDISANHPVRLIDVPDNCPDEFQTAWAVGEYMRRLLVDNRPKFRVPDADDREWTDDMESIVRNHGVSNVLQVIDYIFMGGGDFWYQQPWALNPYRLHKSWIKLSEQANMRSQNKGKYSPQTNRKNDSVRATVVPDHVKQRYERLRKKKEEEESI